MMQKISKRLCRDILNGSCMGCQDMPEQMGSNTDRFAGSCGKSQTIEEKPQQITNISCTEMANSSVLGCGPLKEIWFRQQIFCLPDRRFRRHHGDGSTMGCPK